MNSAIEMHDSECVSIEIDSRGQGTVIFDAYVHRTDGEPGRSAGDGGIQRIRMKIEDAKIEGRIGELPTYLYEGCLTVGSALQENMIPFPAEYSAATCLRMMFAEDARIVIIRGTGISIEAEGLFKFVEFLPVV